MRKSTFLAAALLVAAGAYAGTPQFKWGKLIDSPQTQDLSSKVVLSSDGNYVSLSNFGSRTAADVITFDGVEIATGAATISNSDNLNLLVIKHNAADGSLRWRVSSKFGDFLVSSYSDMTATADGGVLVLVNGRSSSQSVYSAPILVDNSGNEVTFDNWNTSVWMQNQVLIKIDADGNIEWARNIVMDQLPVPAASSGTSVQATTQGVMVAAVNVDAEGNIYIGGNYRAPMILTGEKNATYIPTARNIASYNGDVQNAAGGLYVIRLDKDGNYVNHLRASGELTRDQANLFCIDGSTLYLAGSVKGASGDKLTIVDKSITLKNTYEGFFVASIPTTLKTINYLVPVTAYGNKSSKNSTKLRDLKLIDGKLYIAGGGTGGYGDASSTAAQVASTGTTEEGWLIALNSADGSWAGAANNATNIGAYLSVFPYGGNIYVYGYRLNSADGSFLDEYPAGSFTRANRYTIAKGGGAPTGYSAAFDPTTTMVVTLSRGNAAFTYGDGTTSAAPTSWGGLIAAYQFESTATSATAATATSFTARGAEGSVVLTASAPTAVTIVNAAGQTVASLEAPEGTTSVALPAGLYLVNGQKLTVR